MTTTSPLIDLYHIAVCRNPVFVIGSPRSGTSILASSLGQHSAFWYSTETNFVCNYFRRLDFDDMYAKGTYWLKKEEISRDAFAEFVGHGINAIFTSRSGGRRWIEKTPRNTLVVDTLADAFPQARFVHTLRDGREAVHSMINFLAVIPEEVKDKWKKFGGTPAWSKTFEAACTTWQEHVNVAMAFADNHPNRCLTVRYDDLTENPRDSFQDIFRFLDVPHEDSSVDFFFSHRIQSSFPERAGESRAPKEANSPWDNWSPDQKRFFVDKAGATMLRYGLVTDEEMCKLTQGAS